MTAFLAIGLVVATWRITRLLVLEQFPPARALREWIVNSLAVFNAEDELVGGRRWGWLGYSIAYIWTCPWCMSVYVGLAVWGLADWQLSVPYPWLIVAAGSGFSGVMSWIDTAHEQRWEIRQSEIARIHREAR